MDLSAIVQNPLFVFVTGVLGGICGALLKGRVDIWTSEAKWRQELRTNFIKQIEILAPSYYLMSNHAYLLSWHLDLYLQTKNELEMTLMEQDNSGSAYELLSKNAKVFAAGALFEAGKLFRIITDRFWNEGGAYLVPDQWAGEALAGLHNKIMSVLVFDANILLKHLDSEIERHQFLAKLQQSESDESLKDLRQQYDHYQDWLLKQDKEVKLLAANAQAYSDLFILEMKRLYKDVWGESQDDPLQAPETTQSSSPLSAGTRELIRSAAQDKKRLRTSQEALHQQTTDLGAPMADAFVNVGWNYYNLRQWDLAIREYDNAIARDPRNAMAFNNLGNAYTSKGDYKNAETAYQRTLELEPENPIFNHNLGKMLNRDQRWAEAVPFYEKAISLGRAAYPSNDSQQANRHNDLGLAFASLERWDEAIASHGEAIALQPLEPVLYANLAAAYEGKHAGPVDQTSLVLDAAVGTYKMAAGLSSGDQAARYWGGVADVYVKLRSWRDAISASEQAVSLAVSDTEKAERLYQLGRIHEKQGEWEKAADAYARALTTGGNKNSLHASKLVDALCQSGTPVPDNLRGQAIGTCEAAIKSAPTDPVHHARLGGIYYRLRDYLRFLEECDKVVRLAAADRGISSEVMAGYYDQLGLAYRRLNLWEMALNYYQKAIQLQGAPKYHRHLGLALHAHRLYDQALEPLEKARNEGKNDDYDILLALAEVYCYGSKPDLERAKQMCMLAADKRTNDPGPFAVLARMFMKEELFVEAADAYWKAVMASKAEEKVGFLKSCIEACDRAVEVRPDSFELQHRRGRALHLLKDYVNAEEAYRKALELAADHRLDLFSIHNSLAAFFYEQKDYEKAKADWEKSLEIAAELAPEDQRALSNSTLVEQIRNNLGTAYDALNEKEKAFGFYWEVARSSPGNPVPRFNLGTRLYKDGQFDRALSQFQEAFRLKPTAEFSRLMLFRIGNCYFRLNLGDLAREKWEEAAGIQTRFAEPLYNLGVLAWHQGNRGEAGKHWERALLATPDLADAKYNLGVLNLKLGDKEQAVGHLEPLAASPGFESVAQSIAAIKSGEECPIEIRDIKDS